MAEFPEGLDALDRDIVDGDFILVGKNKAPVSALKAYTGDGGSSGAWPAEASLTGDGFDSATFDGGVWSRIGDAVTCSGRLTVVPSDPSPDPFGLVIVTFATPIPSAFASGEFEYGCASACFPNLYSSAVVSYTPDTLALVFTPTDTTSQQFSFTLQYGVIEAGP